MEKELENTNVEQAKERIPDLKVYGNGDLFQLIAKASSKRQKWMKSTKTIKHWGNYAHFASEAYDKTHNK